MNIAKPWDILENINSGAKPLTNEWDENVEKVYVPFMINRGLSYHFDTVLIANAANQMAHVDKIAQYQFLKSIVKPKKRHSKWFKPENTDLINKIVEAYGCSKKEAEAYSKLLSKEQLEFIDKNNNKGG